MIHEDPRQIKVINVGKLKGSKPVDVRKVDEVKLLNGVNKIDYRRSGDEK